jgi:hypothetical protein
MDFSDLTLFTDSATKNAIERAPAIASSLLWVSFVALIVISFNLSYSPK